MTYQHLLNSHSGLFDSLHVFDGVSYVDLGEQASSHASKITQLETHINSPTAIKLNGMSSYLEFTTGRGNILDLTHDWSIAVSTDEIPPVPPDSYKLALFGSGGTSLLLHRNALPSGVGAVWGSHNTSDHDLFHVDKRWLSNGTLASPVSGGRILHVYTASTKKMQYCISEPVGIFDQRANITVAQTAIDGQTLGPELTFGKPFDGYGGHIKGRETLVGDVF